MEDWETDALIFSDIAISFCPSVGKQFFALV
jgi:hypothetical protein